MNLEASILFVSVLIDLISYQTTVISYQANQLPRFFQQCLIPISIPTLFLLMICEPDVELAFWHSIYPNKMEKLSITELALFPWLAEGRMSAAPILYSHIMVNKPVVFVLVVLPVGVVGQQESAPWN